MRSLSMFATALAIALTAQAAQAAILVPDSATAPFESWSRGDANSTYAEWDSFSDANGGDNAPDVGESGLTGANLIQNGAFSILTSGGNIYSFLGETNFDVTLPSYDLGSGVNTRVVAQTQTLGSAPDLDSVRLTYSDGATDVLLAPDYVFQEEVADAGFTGLVSTFGWDVLGSNPPEFLFELNASASSMSLANLAIDTFAQTATFASFPTTVPEPTALLIAVLAGLGVTCTRRR